MGPELNAPSALRVWRLPPELLVSEGCQRRQHQSFGFALHPHRIIRLGSNVRSLDSYDCAAETYFSKKNENIHESHQSDVGKVGTLPLNIVEYPSFSAPASWTRTAASQLLELSHGRGCHKRVLWVLSMFDLWYMVTVGYMMYHDILIYFAINFMSPVLHDLDSTSRHCPATGHQLARDLGRVTKSDKGPELDTSGYWWQDPACIISIHLYPNHPNIPFALGASLRIPFAAKSLEPRFAVSAQRCTLPCTSKATAHSFVGIKHRQSQFLCLLWIRVLVSKMGNQYQ